MPQKLLNTSQVKVTEHIQNRAKTDHTYVDILAERLLAGDELPAIQVVTDGKSRWLCDGNHRLLAAQQAGKKIEVMERKGNRRDAVLLSLAANSTHGMRRTNSDKRRVIEVAKKEFPKLSNRKIADICCVSHSLVNGMKSKDTPPVGRVSGNNSTQDHKAGKIGKSKDTPPVGRVSGNNSTQDHKAGKIGKRKLFRLCEKSFGELYRNSLRLGLEEEIYGRHFEAIIKGINRIGGKK